MEITLFNGGQRYITDIYWEPRVPKSEYKKLFETASKEKAAKYGLVHHFNNYSTVGILTAENGKVSKPKHQSAAILLSIANSQEYSPEGEVGLGWIFVQRVEGSKYWVGAAYNGHPYLRDRTVAVEDVRAVVGDLISDIRAVDVDANVSVFASEEDVFDVLTNAFGAFDKVVVSRREFDDLTSNVKYKVEVKAQATAAGLLMLLLGFGGLLVGGYLAFEWWEELQEQELAKLREQGKLRDAETLREVQRKYEQDKVAAVKKAKEDAVVYINEKLTRFDKTQTIKEWVKIIGNETTELPGWNFREFRCVLEDDKPVCHYRIERSKETNVGTVKRLYNHYQATDVEFDRRGEEAKVKRGSDVQLYKLEGDYQVLDGYKRLQFQLDGLSKLQELQVLGIDRTINPTLPITFAVTLPKPPEGVSQKMGTTKENGEVVPFQISLGIEEGTFRVNGTGQYQLLGIAERLAQLEKPIKITRLRFIPGETEDWEVEGSYFYQSDIQSNLDNIENEIPKSTIQEIK